MATIENLKTSLLELSEKELRDLITRRRFQRRVEPIKPKAKKKKAVAKKRKKKPISPAALAKLLSPEQKKALAKLLIGG